MASERTLRDLLAQLRVRDPHEVSVREASSDLPFGGPRGPSFRAFSSTVNLAVTEAEAHLLREHGARVRR